jgi:hypothetical protein
MSWFGGGSNKYKKIVDDLATIPSIPGSTEQFNLLSKIEIKDADALVDVGLFKQFGMLLQNKSKLKSKANKKHLDLVIEFASISKYSEKLGRDEQMCAIVMNQLIENIKQLDKKKVKLRKRISVGNILGLKRLFTNKHKDKNKDKNKRGKNMAKVAPAAFGGTPKKMNDDLDMEKKLIYEAEKCKFYRTYIM